MDNSSYPPPPPPSLHTLASATSSSPDQARTPKVPTSAPSLQPKISFIFPQREMSPPRAAQRAGSLTRLRFFHPPSPHIHNQLILPQPPPQRNSNATRIVFLSHPHRRRRLLFDYHHRRQRQQRIALAALQNHEHSVPKFGHQKRDSAPHPSPSSSKTDFICFSGAIDGPKRKRR